MNTGESRRKFFRKPVMMEVRVRRVVLPSGKTQDVAGQKFMAKDISGEGMGIVSPVALPEQALLDLEFRLASEETDFKVRAEVRNCKPGREKGQAFLLGVLFQGISREQQIMLSNYSSVSIMA